MQLFKPNTSEAAIEAVAEVLRSGWIGLGPRVEEFEEKFTNYVGAKYAVALSSCAAALHLAFIVRGVEEGDEVIATHLTCSEEGQMNVAYLIFDEILWHPVIKGQVVELIKKIKPKAKIDNYYLISFLPLHRILKNRKKISAARDELENFGIDLVLMPTPYFPRRFAFAGRWYLLPVVLLATLPVLLCIFLIKEISLFHCRSYPITTAALILKRIFGTKFIFDPRSDFPEENITAGRWTETSLSFKMWKLLERLFLKNSNATIAIASTYNKHFQSVFRDSRLYEIPNNVDVEKFVRDDSFRDAYRDESGIGRKIVFCYEGSMGYHWHNPEVYAQYIVEMRALQEDHIFLFVIPKSDVTPLKETFDEYGIDSAEYLVEHADFTDVPKYLSVADFGLEFMERYKIAMGIKFAEYLAMGLPVVINSQVGGARTIIEEYGVGTILDLGQNNFLEQLIELIENRDEIAKKCRSLAEALFSNEVVSNRYAHLYEQLLYGV
jgi:glycosyltransferase involved in cell wall biosynthesis